MAEGFEPPRVHVAPPGPRSRALAERLAAVESESFEARRASRQETSGADQAPIVYAEGRGCNVVDVDDNRYVDLTAGFGALALGYAPNAATVGAAAALARLPLALGDVYASEDKVLACEAIAALFPEPGARVMLGLSGADAVTCALKTAMLATGKPGVVAFEGSYHGLSHGPLAACGLAPRFREPFAAQLGEHVTFAPFPAADAGDPRASLDASLSAVRRALALGDVSAVLAEPLLGRGGCVVPPAGFLAELSALCREAGALLVLDEVWTGVGRAGAMLACEGEGVVPDVVCLGKALGGGLPISACVGRAEVMAPWGTAGGATIHTGTHFGAPPACAAAVATLAEIRARDLPARAASLGASLLRDVVRACAELPGPPVRVRGKGLMVGVVLADAAEALALARGLLGRGYIVLTGGVRGDTLTLTPPLVTPVELLAGFCESLAAELRALRGG